MHKLPGSGDDGSGMPAPVSGERPYRDRSAWLAEYGPLALVVLIGVVLRLAAYLSVRTLYLDEAALALNLRWRSLSALLGTPLEFAQTAPAGFLLQQKLLLTVLGEHELVLRLVPFLAAIAALPLFVMLARRLLSPRAALVAAALFAASFYLIYYGSDSKPYMLDVLVTVVALFIGLDVVERTPSGARVVACALFGAAAVWLSQPAALVLSAVAAIMVVAAWRQERRRELPRLGAIIAVWGASAAASLAVTYRTLSPDHHAYMRDFWQGGFIPLPPTSVDDLFWLPFKLVEVGTEPLGSMIPGVVALMLLLGIFRLPRLGLERSLLITLPVIVTIGASALGEYPFGGGFGVFAGRVILFLVPCLLLIVGAGVEHMMELTRPRVAGAIMLLLVLGNVLRLLIWFPAERTELRPLLAYMADHRDQFDALYVAYADRHVYEWYAPLIGLKNVPTVNGICATNRPAAYIRDLERIPASARAWVTLTHVQPHEGELMLDYLRLNADGLATASAAGGARAVLVRMDDDTSAGALDAIVAQYWVPPQFRRVGCRGSHEWPQRVPPRARGSTTERADDPLTRSAE